MKEWRKCFNKTFFSLYFSQTLKRCLKNPTFAEVTGLCTMPGLRQLPTMPMGYPPLHLTFFTFRCCGPRNRPDFVNWATLKPPVITMAMKIESQHMSCWDVEWS